MTKPANLPSAPSQIEETDLVERFVHDFEIREEVAGEPENERFAEVRQTGIEQFERLGIPTTKNEYYKYSAVDRQLKSRDYTQHVGAQEPNLTHQDLEPFRLPNLESRLIVLVNGRYVEELSSIGTPGDGIIVENLSDAAENHPELFNAHFARYADPRREAFIALNTAFVRDGVFVHVEDGAVAEKPIHVLNLVDGEDPLFVQPRNLIVVGEHSQARIVESYHSTDGTASFTNTLTEVAVGERAHVSYDVLQLEGEAGSQLNTTQVRQDDESTFSTNTFTLTGEFVRNNLNIVVDGEHCETNLYGLYLTRGEQHVDNHTLVDHAKPNCHSNELYRGIMDESSRGVFNGRVLVRKHAQKINAFQSDKNILLSEDAAIDTKPELEIYADDVECSHGATIGQLDEEGMFYMRSRGIPEKEARRLMLYAFAKDVIDHVAVDGVREHVDDLVSNRLN